MRLLPWRQPAVDSTRSRSRVGRLNDVSLRGAASIVSNDKAKGGAPQGGSSRADAWQGTAWDYYDTVGEAHEYALFMGDCLSRVPLRLAWLDDNGEPGELYEIGDVDGEQVPVLVEGADQGLVDLAQSLITGLRAQTGGQSAIMRAFGQNLVVPGECFLVGFDVLDEEQRVVARSWEVLSKDELVKDPSGDGYSRRARPGATPIPLGPNAYPVRVWIPHPRWSDLADSSIRSNLDVLEEVMLLTRSIRAGAVSRLVQAGIMWVPDEIDFPGTDDEDDDVHPFQRTLINVASTAIADKGSAAATVPLVASVPKDLIKEIRHDKFEVADDAMSVLKRREAIERLAQGVHLPAERITGLQKSNHWTAWAIGEDTFKLYIEPLVLVVVDALTGRYLHPQLMLSRGLGVDAPPPDDVRRLVVWYDPEELIGHPDQGPSSVLLYDRYEVSAKALRRAHGFAETDRPSEDELAARMERRPGVMWAPAEDEEPEAQPGNVEPGPPPPPSEGTAQERYSTLIGKLTLAGEHAVERAVQRAGSRLRDKCRGRTEDTLRTAAMTATPRDVPRIIGEAGVRELGVKVADLFVGEFTAYSGLAESWARQAGHPNPEHAAASATAVVEDVARRRLFEDTLLEVQHLARAVASTNGDHA